MPFWKTLATGAAAALIASLAVPAVAADTNFKIAFLGSEDDEDYDGSLVFKNYVEATSNGTLGVEIFPNGRFCSNADECSEALLDGQEVGGQAKEEGGDDAYEKKIAENLDA